MTIYPGAIDEFREVENIQGVTYAPEDTKTVFAEDTNNHSDAIVAIEEAIGVEPAGAFATVADRIDDLESRFAALDDRYFPVGTIYGNGIATTNPSGLLGFGTWEPYAAGRAVVGKAASGTFGTLGQERGSETVTLTTAQIPAHRHQFTTAANETLRIFSTAGGGNSYIWNSGQPTREQNINTSTVIQETGGGGSHNNIQPSIVAALWIRTA